MSVGPNAPPASTTVRGAIDFRRFAWVRPLVADYGDRFDSVASLFPGNPADPAVWRDIVSRVRPAARHRGLVARVLTEQLDQRGAPPAARSAAGTLASPDSVAILTGQQAGLFGGPLYTLLKAITAIQLARRLHADLGVPAVPVFWVDAEDHDWDEIRTATTLDRDFTPCTVALASLPGCGSKPVGTLALEASVSQTLTALGDALPPTEFTAQVLDALARRYRAGVTVSAAFAGWIEDLLGRHGLVVFDASDPGVKPALGDLFAAELSAPSRTSELVRAAGAAMGRLGHQPQLDPAADSVNMFYLDGSGRRSIKLRDGQYVIGDTVTRPVADLATEASAHPERFSPNVVLRPLVQDRLFPTVCYVAGPAELAYQAQLGAVYRAFGMVAPLLYTRGSATLLDSASIKFLERHDVSLESLHVQDESVLNRLLERQLPPSIDRAITESEQWLGERMRELREAVASVDPTLSGTVDTTFDRVKDNLKTLHSKIVQASKKKDETLRRQFVRTRSLAFPGGHPQERVVSIAFFANRYGMDLASRLLDALPNDTRRHYVLVL